jgi:RES domain-containing protein
MRIFRIEREKYLAQTLQGLGAARASAFRWNSMYTPMVYASSSRALALLEVAVHLNINSELPSDRFYVEIEVPDQLLIESLDRHELPAGWDARPPLMVSQQLGDAFVRRATAAVLRVPSCIVPAEYNFLINPAHPDARLMTVLGSERVNFDKRLL